MPVNTETKNAILITDKDAQYDERAKRLLGQKSILAPIAKGDSKWRDALLVAHSVSSNLRCVYDNTFSNKFESLSKIRYT